MDVPTLTLLCAKQYDTDQLSPQLRSDVSRHINIDIKKKATLLTDNKFNT